MSSSAASWLETALARPTGQRIPVAGPWITRLEVDYVADAAASAWYQNANTYHQRFEQAFADYLGVKRAMSLPSCTSAIHLALLALGVGPGDEVIVPDVTWIASAAPVTYVGATTVFADVDPVTWCLCPQSLQACITAKTKAVIPVDLYGGMADYHAINAIAAEHGIAVIEDAAEAAGAIFHGRKAGSLGRVGVFSFHGSKTLTTGEGGMLVTDDQALFDLAAFLRDHGRPPGDRMFFNRQVAYKYKMSAMQAAMGLAQVQRLEELIARKQEIFGWYQEELGRLPGVRLNAQPAETRNAYWMVSPVWDQRYAIDKVGMMKSLDERGIDSRPFFSPLSSLPAYAAQPQAALARQRNAAAYSFASRAVNVPSALLLTRQQVATVGQAVREILDQHRQG